MARRVITAPNRKIQLATPEITEQGTLVARQDARDSYRRRFGRAISMDVIEMAFRAATRGSMSALADLSRETVDTDPHLASVLQKRFGAVSQLPFEIQAAVGPTIDSDLAMWYAQVVREQIRNIPDFRDVLFLLAWALFDGRAAFENKWADIVGTVGPGNERIRWVIRQIDWIHPRRLNFGPYRELRVVDESTMGVGGSFAPVGLSLAPSDLMENNLWRKFIQWCPKLFSDYQEREGLALRCLYWSFFKRYSARDRMQLVELFGKPWRILKVDPNSPASETALQQADEIIDRLGHSYSARLPRGVDAEVVQPGVGAGEAHAAIIEESDKQMSKLVLGQTGTTDGVPAGINSDQAAVMQNEQYMILINDSQKMSEVVTRELVNAIIELNFGAPALTHAPRFILRFDKQNDRASELARLQSTLDAGLPVKIEQAYEVSGFTQPDQDDIVLQMDQPPTPPLSPVAPSVRPVIVYPQGASPAVGEQNPAPPPASIDQGAEESNAAAIGSADVAAITTVNEARASQGLGPLMLPDGSLDPDGNLTIDEFRAKKSAKVSSAQEVAAERRLVRLSSDNPLMRACDADPLAMRVIAGLSGFDPNNLFPFERVCCAEEHAQPETEWGSPEQVMQDGLRSLGTQTGKWADQYASAVDGLDTPLAIMQALEDVFVAIDTEPYSEILGDHMIHSDALGALDHASEVGMVSSVAASKSIQASFATDPLSDAIEFFINLTVVTRAVWDVQEERVRRTAFTVAGVQNEQMLQAIQFELARQVEVGNDLREFKKALMTRLKSNGMIPSIQDGLYQASHVETVFRTNVLNTYNHGRVFHARQPEVLRNFPIWQIRVVRDSRTRRTHRRVDRVKLMASDPFWLRAYPPFGYNCRCRVTSLPTSKMFGVSSGSSISGLPDRGFTSGYPTLLATP